MRVEPQAKRAYVFFDGQNLFHSAKESFGYETANYDPQKLAAWVCSRKGWELERVYFCTGIHSEEVNPGLYRFWTRRLIVMRSRGIHTYSRTLSYRPRELRLPDGTTRAFRIGQEKGIDVHLAVDVLRFAYEGLYDVGIVFSQDQDLTEVANAVKALSLAHDRWIKLASAFPKSPRTKNARGIDGTDWIPIDRPDYDQCLDPIDYFEPLSHRR